MDCCGAGCDCGWGCGCMRVGCCCICGCAVIGGGEGVICPAGCAGCICGCAFIDCGARVICPGCVGDVGCVYVGERRLSSRCIVGCDGMACMGVRVVGETPGFVDCTC